ncbi:MAG: leucine-rich repeat domain-containing protein [archaeon]|nr:leucine-rich repeat domain-containing protein [archaeon]
MGSCFGSDKYVVRRGIDSNPNNPMNEVHSEPTEIFLEYEVKADSEYKKDKLNSEKNNELITQCKFNILGDYNGFKCSEISESNTEVFINDKSVPFTTKFAKEGKFKVKLRIKSPHKLKNTEWMFFCCSSLISADLTKFKADNIINTSHMFDSCINLVDIKFPEKKETTPLFSKVQFMEWMFAHCLKLKRIDLSNLSFKDIKSINHMVYDCKSLESIKFPKEEMKDIYNFLNLFSGCSSLKSIENLPLNDNDWIMEGLFDGCDKLPKEYKGKILKRKYLQRTEMDDI